MAHRIDLSGKPFHFIGIGGIGMSALAYVLAKTHLPVSGSDIRSSHITDRLQSVGVRVFTTQEANNLQTFSHPPQIIWSTAIGPTNSEYSAAMAMDCPIFHRSDLLAALIEKYYTIAVAGTHGKTTTSSLMGYVLLQAGLDPTIIIGGEVNAWEGNARVGEGQYLVAEADESDGSLAKHCPKIGIVTNIELDHPDHYQDVSEVVKTFQVFARQCELLVGCVDCPLVKEKLELDITYSIEPGSDADYTVTDITFDEMGRSITKVWEKGTLLGEMVLQIPGKHNISNALAVIAVARKLGVEFEVIASAIANFTGAKRRFEEKGRCGSITLIDDYAHHPSEIIATLAAAKIKAKNQQRVVAVFQPHRYSRTQAFLSEFALSFSQADLVVVTDIYSAGETNPTGLTGQNLADAISEFHPLVVYHDSLKTLAQRLIGLLQPEDLVLFLGAGNVNQVIPEVIDISSKYNLA